MQVTFCGLPSMPCHEHPLSITAQQIKVERLILVAGFPNSRACPASEAVFRPEVVRRPRLLRLESSSTLVPCCFSSAASCLA
eukprot:scaffold78476_cov47-Phaeocystis_antarctica.AAC.2